MKNGWCNLHHPFCYFAATFSRSARFSSALSVQTFTKKISLIATSPDYARTHADKIARLARLEGLEAHARSVETRKIKD